MRTRPRPDTSTTDLARRRLEALSRELGLEVEAPEEVPPEPPRPVTSAPAGRGGRHALPRLDWRERAGLWAEERRAGFGSAHLAVVALVVAGSLVLGAWHLVGSRGADPAPGAPTLTTATAPTTAPTAAPTDGAAAADAEPAGDGTPSGAGSTSTADQIVVDVAGRVRRPGIAVLPAGSRVVDALKAAGGRRPGTSLAGLNLARPLVDGEQIVVGRASVAPPAPAPSGTTPGATTGSAPAALVNLNTADQATLETLPGVGPVTAQAILQWRAEHGAFSAVEELLEVSGIGDATLAEIAPHVTI